MLLGVLLQGIFPAQGANLGLPCCRQILYCLSHQRTLWYIKAQFKCSQETFPLPCLFFNSYYILCLYKSSIKWEQRLHLNQLCPPVVLRQSLEQRKASAILREVSVLSEPVSSSRSERTRSSTTITQTYGLPSVGSQSRTRLKWLSSSSRSTVPEWFSALLTFHIL